MSWIVLYMLYLKLLMYNLFCSLNKFGLKKIHHENYVFLNFFPWKDVLKSYMLPHLVSEDIEEHGKYRTLLNLKRTGTRTSTIKRYDWLKQIYTSWQERAGKPSTKQTLKIDWGEL